MSSEGVYLGLTFLAGMALGVFFFGGLWVTIRQIPTSTRPGMVLLASLILRMAVTLGTFMLIMDGSWQRLLACVAGFILMRQLLIRRWGPSRQATSSRRAASSRQSTSSGDPSS
jgi:F1F0 ATPase subunit 2